MQTTTPTPQSPHITPHGTKTGPAHITKNAMPETTTATPSLQPHPTWSPQSLTSNQQQQGLPTLYQQQQQSTAYLSTMPTTATVYTFTGNSHHQLSFLEPTTALRPGSQQQHG